MDEENFIEDVAARFRSERQRLGINQDEVAEACNVSARSVVSWEQGTKIPSHCLAMLVKKGFDVTYILTGLRMQPIAPPPPAADEALSQQEKVIVAKLRMLDQSERDEIEDLVEKVEQAKVAKVRIAQRFRKAS